MIEITIRHGMLMFSILLVLGTLGLYIVMLLRERGRGALVDELYKTASTLRLAADFDELHERLLAELINGN